MPDNTVTDWNLIPGTLAEIEQARERCRRLVSRRALMSAGTSAIPIPGIDLMSDVGLLSMLINDINHEFGLTPEQIEKLNPQFKLMAYRVAIGMGGMLVGKLVTRELIIHLLKRSGVKLATKQVARFVLGLLDDTLSPAGCREASLAEQVDTFEISIIEEALRRHNGNVIDAAAALSIPKKTLYDKLKRFEISTEQFR